MRFCHWSPNDLGRGQWRLFSISFATDDLFSLNLSLYNSLNYDWCFSVPEKQNRFNFPFFCLTFSRLSDSWSPIGTVQRQDWHRCCVLQHLSLSLVHSTHTTRSLFEPRPSDFILVPFLTFFVPPDPGLHFRMDTGWIADRRGWEWKTPWGKTVVEQIAQTQRHHPTEQQQPFYSKHTHHLDDGGPPLISILHIGARVPPVSSAFVPRFALRRRRACLGNNRLIFTV